MSFLTGRAAKIVREKSDKEIVGLCVETLKKMFPKAVSTKQILIIFLVFYLFIRTSVHVNVFIK